MGPVAQPAARLLPPFLRPRHQNHLAHRLPQAALYHQAAPHQANHHRAARLRLALQTIIR